MRVLVCGGRDFGEMPPGATKYVPSWYRTIERVEAERKLVSASLSALNPRPSTIIHGAARGADRLADIWARRNGVGVTTFPADWYPNGRSGGLDRSAGPRRNQRMIQEGKPDLVIAFPGGAGTADMVRRARMAGVEVREIPEP